MELLLYANLLSIIGHFFRLYQIHLLGSLSEQLKKFEERNEKFAKSNEKLEENVKTFQDQNGKLKVIADSLRDENNRFKSGDFLINLN